MVKRHHLNDSTPRIPNLWSTVWTTCLTGCAPVSHRDLHGRTVRRAKAAKPEAAIFAETHSADAWSRRTFVARTFVVTKGIAIRKQVHCYYATTGSKDVTIVAKGISTNGARFATNVAADATGTDRDADAVAVATDDADAKSHGSRE